MCLFSPTRISQGNVCRVWRYPLPTPPPVWASPSGWICLWLPLSQVFSHQRNYGWKGLVKSSWSFTLYHLSPFPSDLRGNVWYLQDRLGNFSGRWRLQRWVFEFGYMSHLLTVRGGGVVGGGKQGVEGAGKLRNSEESQCGGWYEKIAVTGQLHRPCQFCFVEWRGYFSIVNIHIWVNWNT